MQVPQFAVSLAFNTIKLAIQQDPDFAWAYHCNFACCVMDEGVPHGTSNRIAARTMRLIFDVDTTEHPCYKDLFPEESYVDEWVRTAFGNQ
jgi:hypothetical protein